jgi:hypothetical protein
VRRAVGIFVAERAIELGAFFFCNVLPVVEGHGLLGRYGAAGGSE